MSLQQCAWGSSDAAFEVGRRSPTFGRLGGTPIPASSAGRGPGPLSTAYPQTAYSCLAYIFTEKGISSLQRKLPSPTWGGFYFTLLQVGEVPSLSSLGVSGKESRREPAVADTQGSGSDRVTDSSGAAGPKQVGTEPFPGPGRGVRPRVPPLRREVAAAGARPGGRGGGGAEGAEITAAPLGTPRAPSGPHAGPQTMTTGNRSRSNKKESLPRAPPPPAACPGGGPPGGLQWPRAPASPAPAPRASARLPAARLTLCRSRLPRKTSSRAA